MRKKLISKTYMRDVINYDFKMRISDDLDYYLINKKIIKIKEPYFIENKCLINNNYLIIEILPKKENYVIRIFIDDKNNILQYYIDITKENNIEDDTLVPYYDDLFLDIIITDGKIIIDDRDELDNALNNKIISENDYNLAVQVKDKLLNEITREENRYLNMSIEKIML